MKPKHLVLCVFWASFACKNPKAPQTPSQQTPSAHTHAPIPSSVTLSPQMFKQAGIRTEEALPMSLPFTLDVTGELSPDPDKRASVSAQVQGRIASVHFKEGQRVKKGTLLAVVESEKLALARAHHTSTSAQAKTARAHADRQKHLLEKGLSSAQDVDIAESEAVTKEAEARAAFEVLSAFGAQSMHHSTHAAQLAIVSPLDGHILHRNAVLGQTVNADTVIADIARFDDMFFLGRVFEKDLTHINAMGKAEVHLQAYPQEVFVGTVENVGKNIDPTTRTVLVRIKVQNKQDLLKSGLFGTAKLVSEKTRDTSEHIAIPVGSVVDIAQQTVVFVHTDALRFEVHPVVKGRSAAGYVEILSGLKPHEKVATDGLYTLKSLVLKSTFSEE